MMGAKMYLEKLKTFGFEGSGNYIFEGDNKDGLEVLKCTHRSAVDCIYIDPPYNTGSRHFVYKDSFSDANSGYESEWATFMRPRLISSRELLNENGVIFISIDDNEIGNLLVLMDAIYGRSSRIGIFCKTIQGGKNDSKFVKSSHEYLVVYGKSKSSVNRLKRKSVQSTSVQDQQLNKWGDNDRRTDRPNLYYPIYVSEDGATISTQKFPNSKPIFPIKSNGEDGCWRWGKEKVEREKNRLVVKARSNGKLGVYVKAGANENATQPWSSIIDNFPSGGGALIKELFGDAKIFNYAKNLDYIKWILSLIEKKDATYLDFFAGSGTTAHAVLELNKQDGGNRKFILCGNTEATKENPSKNICKDVCAERIKKVVTKNKSLFSSEVGFDYYVVSNKIPKSTSKFEKSIASIAQIKFDLYGDNLSQRLETALSKNELVYLGEDQKGNIFLLANDKHQQKAAREIKNKFEIEGNFKLLSESDLFGESADSFTNRENDNQEAA